MSEIKAFIASHFQRDRNPLTMRTEMAHSNRDPRIGPKPPFPKQQQGFPGSEKLLDPPADHGETSYTGRGRLDDQIAIVTGADSGIGRAVAIAFAREGANIVMSYLPAEEADAAEVAAVIEQTGKVAIRRPGDIRDSGYAKQLVDTAREEFGKLDLVVNVAGFQMSHEAIDEVSPEELDRTFRTNVYGTFFLIQAALPHLKPGAVILNTTSIQAYDPSEKLVAYAASKAADLSLTKSIAKLAAKQGVRVNGVAPGPVWTPLIPSTMPPEKVSSFGENTAFGRPAQPIELAKVFVFLASDDATYVTGEIYEATGGRTPY
jgi:NAD(P)-dependent dehydrogenase (short-subunit alcohol dehydrogenase family)